MMTLHQLRIFWAVAHSESLTKASKQLGLAQPSLSQQLAKLEDAVGTKLFTRTRNQMELTDAGKFLVRKAEMILGGVDEAMAGLRQLSDGKGGVITMGGLNSIARVIVPGAITALTEKFPGVEVDIHEVAPAEAIEMLYGRRLNIALLAANSLAGSEVSFSQVDIVTDPYVLAVPSGIDLSAIVDPDAELPPEHQAIVNRCIQFNFGTAHNRRVERWYQQFLPHHGLVAQTRTYDVALSLVQARLVVALVPAQTAHSSHTLLSGVTLYDAQQENRRIVALVPSQYLHTEPYPSFLKALQDVGRRVEMPPIEPAPPFLQPAADAAQ
jgi:DNA-binding transcriptional LysR family regulator